MSLLIHMKYTLFLNYELTVQIEISRRTAFIKRGFYRVYWCYQIGVYMICTESGIKCQSTSPLNQNFQGFQKTLKKSSKRALKVASLKGIFCQFFEVFRESSKNLRLITLILTSKL